MNDDTISRQAVINVILHYTLNPPYYMNAWAKRLIMAIKKDLMDDIEELPTAERHGRWEKKYVPTDFDGEVFNVEHIVCSVCESAIPLNRIYKKEWYSDYCPSCGSRMDLEDEVEEWLNG